MHAPLMGTYNHTMDAKGRMAFPGKLREQLGVNFVIASVYGGKATIKEMDSNGMRWTLELKDLKAA